MSKGLMKKTALASSALCLMGGMALADQVILDDLIVDGSACIGQDCVNGESFGFDTIKMKENNLRIKADDTSVSASFPNRDWQLTFNDSSNGGANKFSVDDITGSRTPFTIEAGAPSHSLYVDDGGRIGLGTSTPVAEIHIKDGDTPTLRLEQDGSSGFTPQIFDVAANETNFFVRDASNGSTLPFRIRPGAPSSAIDIDGNGNVGIGTSSPGNLTFGTSASVHIRRTNGNASLLVEEASGTIAPRVLAELRNEGVTILALTNTEGADHTWNIQNRGANANNEFRIVNGVGAGEEFILDANGNVTITGSITTSGGTCGGGCDAVFTDEYDLPSISEHTEAMYALGYLPNVGPTVENTAINVSDKLGRMLNELEHAHIYIAELHDRINKLEQTIAQ